WILCHLSKTTINRTEFKGIMKFLSKALILFIIFLGTSVKVYSQQILIPMDVNQNNHLKAYGLIYNVIKDGGEAQWLLNYRGGSFLAPQNDNLVRNARIKGISIESISDAEANRILMEIEG